MSEHCQYRNTEARGDAACYAVLFALVMWVVYGLYRLFFFNPRGIRRRR